MSGGPLRVLIVHNAYQQRGGEDAVVEAEAELLRSNGQAVQTYFRHNDELRSMSRARAALDTVWSERAVREVRTAVAGFHPDVVHFHNTFPLISPAAYWAARGSGAAVVQTLHNFRLLCPQAMLLRDGNVCERCLGRLPLPGVLHACYRDSRLQTGVVAAMLGVHRAAGSFRRAVDRYIALNEFCRGKFVQAGWPEDRIRVKPNFVPDPSPDPALARSGGLFVGRLAPEKGLKVIADALTLRPSISISIIGNGPLEPYARRAFGATYLGARAQPDVLLAMQRARYLVLPSLWYENFPRTLVEAFACGLPVIASRLGAMAELVSEGHTGLLFAPADAADLAAKLEWAEQHPDRMAEMGLNARRAYEALYAPSRNWQSLMQIYQEAIVARSARQDREHAALRVRG